MSSGADATRDAESDARPVLSDEGLALEMGDRGHREPSQEDDEHEVLRPVSSSGGAVRDARDRNPSCIEQVKANPLGTCLGVSMFTLVLVLLIMIAQPPENATNTLHLDGVEGCVREHLPKVPLEGRGNAQLDKSSPEWLLLRHCQVWTGEQEDPKNPGFDAAGKALLVADQDVLFHKSIIEAVGATGKVNAPEGASVTAVDAQGRPCTPGLVDMHSHAGVYGWPEVWARSDGNEMTDPTYPQVRAMDAFDPEDLAIPQIMGGGVTTSQILPGSGNVMGGEGFVVKLRGKTVRDMYVPGSPRLLKMACGENPKRIYGRGNVGHIGQTPMSRMGSAWLMRQKFEAAAKVIKSQEAWCESPHHDDVHEEDNTVTWDPQSDHHAFPSDLSLDSLTALLRGEARLHVHCYEVEDLEMVLRLSKEFNFTVAAFHHALEAYKIPDILLDAGVTIATFSDLWGYKMEAYDASVRGPKVLNAAGVPVALKSDHPVIFARDLLYEAAKSHNYGLPRFSALAAVTSVPADAIGMGGRVGRLKAGHHADVVVWDRDPLTLGARPWRVYINGEVQLESNRPFVTTPTSTAPAGSGIDFKQISGPGGACTSGSAAVAEYAVSGVDVFTMQDGAPVTTARQTLLVKAGKVACMSSTASGTCEAQFTANTAVFQLTGGTVTPGMIETMSHVGQMDLESEDSTQDGRVPGSGTDGSSAGIMAVDGIRMRSRHVLSTLDAGVTVAVSQPQGSQLVAGQSVAFETAGIVVDDALVRETVALHVNIGNSAKSGGMADSVSGQLAALRAVFETVNASLAAPAAANDPARLSTAAARAVGRVITRAMPLVAHVLSADEIASVLRFRKAWGVRLVIAGGAEAAVVRARIAAEGPDVSVMLRARVPNSDFETMRADNADVALLQAAGVRVGLAVGDPENARNLRLEAGWARDAGLTAVQAMAAVTSNVADMFGLSDGGMNGVGRIAVGGRANFVAYDGDPLGLQARPQLVAVGTSLRCSPQQF